MAVDRSQNRSAVFGGLIVAGILALATLIFFVPNLLRLLHPAIEVVAVMGDAGALKKGAAVWIGGHEVGIVELVNVRGIAFDSTERVAVHLRIPKKYAEHIRQDSRVRLTTQRLIGDLLVDVLPGSPNLPPIQDHDTIHARVSGTIEGLLNKSLALTADFHKMFEESGNFQKTAASRTRDVQRLNVTFTAANAQLHELLTALESSPMRTLTDPQWRSMMDHLMATSSELTRALHGAAERARKAKSDALPSLERLMARADTISAQIAALQASLTENGGGLLARAQKDSAIVKGIHEAQVQLDSLMVETKRNPLRFWF